MIVMASKFSRKIFLGCRKFTSQKGREIIYKYKFSKVNTLKKRRGVEGDQESERTLS